MTGYRASIASTGWLENPPALSSWPELPSPQHHRPPAVDTAQVWFRQALIRVQHRLVLSVRRSTLSNGRGETMARRAEIVLQHQRVDVLLGANECGSVGSVTQ